MRTFTLCPSALEVCNFLLLFYRGLQLEVVLESQKRFGHLRFWTGLRKLKFWGLLKLDYLDLCHEMAVVLWAQCGKPVGRTGSLHRSHFECSFPAWQSCFRLWDLWEVGLCEWVAKNIRPRPWFLSFSLFPVALWYEKFLPYALLAPGAEMPHHVLPAMKERAPKRQFLH